MKSELFQRVESFLPRVLKPSRYIGSELNAIQKDPSDVDLRMVICYPDVYEVGMSNLGIRVLYESVNREQRMACERVFSPWPDFEKILREQDIPLHSLESFTPLFEFDVLGFSIGYEMLYTNMLNILELGKIAIRSELREEDSPLVIAGGPSVYNPEPIADFIDAFIIGDGEVVLPEFLLACIELRGLQREKRLERLNSAFDCVYVPALHSTVKRNGFVMVERMFSEHALTENAFTKRTAADHGVGEHGVLTQVTAVKKRIEADLETLPVPLKPIVPLSKIVQDRITVEVNRGCSNGCRFCQAGYVYRPVRERSIPTLLHIIKQSLQNSGYDELSLASLSIGDYTGLQDLVQSIRDEYSGDMVSVSLPSLRINSTSLSLLEMVGAVRKSGLTFAVESPDEKMRLRLNKTVYQNQLEDIIDHIVLVGWRLIKLYFMIGLPMAEEEGGRIVSFLKELASLHPNLKINANISLFVPKPHTPFEYEKQLNQEEAKAIIEAIRETCKGLKVRIKFQEPRMSTVEGILSRGDRQIGDLVEAVFRRGERFSSWDEHFDYNLWVSELHRLEIDAQTYLEPKTKTGQLPWHFIDCGVKSSFLLKELEKAKEGVATENCMFGACSGCGVCDDRVQNRPAAKPVLDHTDDETRSCPTAGHPDPSSQKQKLIVSFTKRGVYRFISHLDLMAFFIRLGRIKGIPFAYSSGFNPKPRLTLPFPLPLGVESSYELAELVLKQPMEVQEVKVRMNSFETPGFEILGADISYRKKSIASERFFHDYRIKCDGDHMSRTVLHERLAGLPRYDDVSEMPISFYAEDGNCVFLRLEGNMSIKKVLGESYLDYPVRRTSIWGVSGNKLKPFL